MQHHRLMAAAICLAIAGCSADIESTTDRGSTEGPATRAPDPFEIDLPADLGLRQNLLERRAIFEGNGLGAGVYESAVVSELARLGIDAVVEIRAMTPASEPEATVHTSGDIPPVDEAPAEGPGCAFARDPAAVEASHVSCRFVTVQALDAAFVDAVRALHESPVPEALLADAPHPDAVRDWYERAVEFGIEHSSLYAMDALRDARLCDVTPTAGETARERGVSIGRDVLRETVARIEAATPSIWCDTDAAIVSPALQEAVGRASELAGDNPLCEGFEPGTPEEAARLSRASLDLRDGIETGMREEAMRESARLVRTWVCVPPVMTGGGGGDGGGGGGTGDPLALDLDGDGLLAVEPLERGPISDVAFGVPMRSEWLAGGDAFVVLDADGDGEIVSTELFGDVTLTADRRLARDGFEALALHDDDGDGVVGVRDAAYPALAAWKDRDGDARADAGEVVPLSALGIVAIDVDAHTFSWSDGRTGAAADLLFRTMAVE